MSVRYMERNAGPNIQESPDRVRNNNSSAKSQYRLEKRVRFEHVPHPSKMHFAALRLLIYAGNATSCEISGIWQS